MNGLEFQPAQASRVLFVDDEEMLLQSCMRRLRQRKRPEIVDTAKCGLLALEKLRDAAAQGTPYDAVISDLIMPGMDGGELLDEVRSQWPDTVRVLLSGQSDLIGRSNVPAAQMRSSKPGNILQILDWIQYAVRLARDLTPATRGEAQRVCSFYALDEIGSNLGFSDETSLLSLSWIPEHMEDLLRDQEDRRTALRLCLATARETNLQTTLCVATCAAGAITARSPELANALDQAASLASASPVRALSGWLLELAGSWFAPPEKGLASLYLLAIWGLPLAMLDEIAAMVGEISAEISNPNTALACLANQPPLTQRLR